MSKPGFIVHSYPVYLSDWRDSETRMRLNLEQRMLLWELIFYAAREGSLPADRESLIKIAAATVKEFDRSWNSIKGCFYEVDGRLQHRKVNETIGSMEAYKRRQSDNGKSGAKTRWRNDGDGMAPPLSGDGTSIASTASASATAIASASAAAWPLAAAAIREPFPETGDKLILRIVKKALSKDAELSDEQIADLIRFAWGRKKDIQKSPGLFLDSVTEEYQRWLVR